MGTNQTKPGDGDVQFARSPIGGKKTADIKFRCSPELKDELDRFAHANGFHSSNELSELVLAIALFGEEHCESVAVDRIRRVAKLVPRLSSNVGTPELPEVDIGRALQALGARMAASTRSGL